MTKQLSPEQKLMKAIFGTTTPSQEQMELAQEKLYEYQASKVTDEDFERIHGESIDLFTNRMMEHMQFCEAVSCWALHHDEDRKYLMDEGENQFKYSQVVDIAQLFYNRGRYDAERAFETIEGLKNLIEEMMNDED